MNHHYNAADSSYYTLTGHIQNENAQFIPNAWLWNCLLLRYNKSSLNDLFLKTSSDILYDAASKGYIGFIQYYITRRGVDDLFLGRDEGDKTPVQLAIANGHLNVIQFIVARNDLSTVHFRDMFKEAAYTGQFAIVDLFLHNRNLPTLHEDENAIISLAAVSGGNLKMLKYLVEKNGFPADVDDREFLYTAAEGANLIMLKYLVEEKFFVVDAHDGDLLYSAALGGNVDLIKYLINEKHLLRNASSYRGTPLHAAARTGKLETVRFFVEILNYTVDIRNSDGATPAHIAAGVSFPVLQYLVEERGANISAESNNGDTLLHIASTAGHLSNVRYLIERKNMSYSTKNRNGMTPLHEAVRNGSLNVVRYLVGEKKANISGRSKDGKNLLHLAVLSGHLEMMKYLIDDLKMFARIEDLDNDNQTVVMVAAQTDSLAILKYLVDEKNASIPSFVIGSKENLLGRTSGKISPRRLATLKYLIEEKGLDFNALSSTNPLKYIYLKYIHCRYTDLCQWWGECPYTEICQQWEEYSRKINASLETLTK